MTGFVTFGFFVIAFPVVIASGGALWLAVAAAYENVRFTHGAEQILSLIGDVRDAASRDEGFGKQPDEDLLNELYQNHKIASVPDNSWGGSLRMVALPPTSMRVETDVPAYACRRLALFFGKGAVDLKLQKMEARDGDGPWSPFFGATAGTPYLDHESLIAACGQTSRATLALILQMR